MSGGPRWWVAWARTRKPGSSQEAVRSPSSQALWSTPEAALPCLCLQTANVGPEAFPVPLEVASTSGRPLAAAHSGRSADHVAL